MTDILIFVLIALTALSLFLLFSLIRSNRQDETLEPYHRALESGLERIERELRDELGRVRQEAATTARGGREEQAQGLDRLAKTLAGQVGQLGSLQAQQLEAFAQQLQRLTQSNEQRFEQLRQSVETRLAAIQTDNATKLEEMRRTVDEKLHATLEQRLGESFKLVSERLEQVHKGLGEMHTLAAGVGDLKKVLTQRREDSPRRSHSEHHGRQLPSADSALGNARFSVSPTRRECQAVTHSRVSSVIACSSIHPCNRASAT